MRPPLLVLLAIMTTRVASAASEEKILFDIPAQPVAAAVNVYAEQARMLFLYRTELAASVRANAVRGRYTATEALDRLLRGTGIAYELTAPDTVVLIPGAERARTPAAAAKVPEPPAEESRGGERRPEVGNVEMRASAPPPHRIASIEEVTVTARRRTERLQDYGGSATVFSAGVLERARVDGLEDIVSRVSNAYFEERTGSAMNIFIRGAGTATNGSATQTDAAVGLYVDGIYSYLQGSRIPLVFYDMDRIEVFKGPQGSLYGRNAVGGAVAAYTARPTHELERHLSLQHAEFESTTAEGRLNVPLGDAWALRVSGYYDERDSYYRNVDPNQREPGEQVRSGRMRLRYQPDDRLDVIVGFERLIEDSGPQILVPLSFGEDLVSVSNTDDSVTRDSNRFVALVDMLVTPGVQLRSISGHTAIDARHSNDQNNLLRDPVRGPFIGESDVTLEGYQITQDVVLSSVSAGRADWLIGASYFKDRQRTRSALISGFSDDIARSGARGETMTEMYAGFIDLSYRVADKLLLEGSLRYSDEERNGRRSDSVVIDPGTGLPFPAGAFEYRNRYSRLSPGATASYFWTPTIMTYARVATAYQSGGINTRPSSVARAVFGPSTAISYELGAKTSWLERRLVANLSVFRMEQDDYQYQVNNPPFNDFQNIGEARTDGLEVELNARITDWLSIPLSFGYLDARLTKLTRPRFGTMQGQPLFGIPKRTATAGVDIDMPVPRLGTHTRFYLRADYFLARGRYLGASPIQLDDYDTLDFKAGLDFAGRYEVYVFGENVFDDIHVITPALGPSRILSSPGRFGIGIAARLN